MINSLITAITFDVVNFLKNQENFYQMSNDEKERTLKESDLNDSLKLFLLQSSEQELLKEISDLMQIAKKSSQNSDNKLLKIIAKYLAQDIGDIIDELPLSFYILPPQERTDVVKGKLDGKNQLNKTTSQILVTYSHQEIVQTTQKLAGLAGDINFIVVQSPREIPSEVRKEIRTNLQTTAPFNYPIFQINKKIIGGVRVSKNGVLQDQSWFARVMKFTSITN